jgi:hypothetical protein
MSAWRSETSARRIAEKRRLGCSSTAPRLALASLKRPWRWRTIERLIALAAMPSASSSDCDSRSASR